MLSTFHNTFSVLFFIEEKIATFERPKPAKEAVEKGEEKKTEKTEKAVKEIKTQTHLQVTGKSGPRYFSKTVLRNSSINKARAQIM